MDFRTVIETAGTCRAFRPDPVPDAVLRRVLDAARFAPSGGNRQPVRLVVVRDPELRRGLRDLYLPLWEAYVARMGANAGPTSRLVARADRFARALHEVPVHVVVCASLADVLATDARLGRLSVVGGASIYPAVENLLLAARDEGLGGALTTLLCAVEPQVKALLGIPEDGIATAALLALGFPAEPFPRKLARRPLDEMVFGDRWGDPLG
jgi:nitroreductase